MFLCHSGASKFNLFLSMFAIFRGNRRV
jgi:hypothetical protein